MARGRWTPQGDGIIVLDPSGDRALQVSGQAVGRVPNAGVIVNPRSASAAYGEGSTASLQARFFNVTGNIQASYPDVNFDRAKRTGCRRPRTRTGTCPSQTRRPCRPGPSRRSNSGRRTPPSRGELLREPRLGVQDVLPAAGGVRRGLFFDGKSSVVMAPGVYYMRGNSQGGGFTFRGDNTTSLNATGVMVFNDKGTSTSVSNIDITGQARVAWTPADQRHLPGDHAVPGPRADPGGVHRRPGRLYFPDALLDVAGTGTNYIGSQMVTFRLRMRGVGPTR